MHVNIIIVQDMVQLDITGPYEVLARVPGWTVDLIADTLATIRTDRGLQLVPTATRESSRMSDILVIPGGAGIDAAMLDDNWIEYVKRESARAEYVFAVCTGSLLLGAAGLLKNVRAGCHWQAREFLPLFGAIVSNERMTKDGKFYTSGGVTSGIDMALRVVADIAGIDVAQQIQLAIEYDPSPPFIGGTPETSPPSVVEAVLSKSISRKALRETQVLQAVAKLSQRS